MNLNNSLIDFRSRFPEMIIINELGDEPQTQICNYVRASLSTISLSPDYESHMYWRIRDLIVIGLIIGLMRVFL